MTPITFQESNVTLQKPPSMTDEECSPLPVWRDGKQCISCWRPNWKERLPILLFGRVWLWVMMGSTQPPVALQGNRDIWGKRFFESHNRRGRAGGFWERWFSGHWNLFWGYVTVYGWNAMHVAINIWTKRWGYICFHPTIRCFGKWWPWYFYVSPDATPQRATFMRGPGVWY